jgi:hypothetical protein
MLNADTRTAQAHTAIAAFSPPEAAAQSAVDAAQATCAAIENLVATEAQVIEKAKAASAAAVLSQVKAGRLDSLPSVSGDRLDSLTLAQEAAAAELLDTQEALAECQANRSTAEHERAEATADLTTRALHLAAHDFARALRSQCRKFRDFSKYKQ